MPTLNLVALGDSVVWGQGCRDEQKFVTLVKVGLERKRGPTNLTLLAHSGACASSNPGKELWGEVPRAAPGVLDELRWLEANGPKPDVLLVDRGINDVSAFHIVMANPFDPDSVADLGARTRKVFGPGGPVVFQDPTWDFHTLDFDRDVALADQHVGPIIDSTSRDLGDFRALGGKLIMWHGWADPLVNPRNSIDYLRSVAARMRGRDGGALADDEAARSTRGFLRLFMAPGLTHCAGGPGLNTFDTLTALEQWVEKGRPPERLIASHTNLGFPDNVMMATPPAGDFTRPLCVWPAVARYVGKGSPTQARSFVCAR